MNGTAISIKRACLMSGLKENQILKLIENRRIFGIRIHGIIHISPDSIPILKLKKAEILRRRSSGRPRGRDSPGKDRERTHLVLAADHRRRSE